MWGRASCVTLLTSVVGCSNAAFVCSGDARCGENGVCEATGFCSFPDPACDSGRRYGKHAGALSETCVEPTSDGTTTDGAADTAAEGTTMDPSQTDGVASITSTSGTDDPSSDADEDATGHERCAWSHQRSVTVDGALADAALTNFPILVQWSDGDLGDVAFADGRDIRFLDQDGMQLDHELELFDASSATMVAWVRVPLLESGASTTLRMQWGNRGAGTQAAPAGVWDDDYLGVWHMSTAPLGEDGVASIPDSTQHAHHGTAVGGLSENDLIPGIVGLALGLDGVDDSITIPNEFKGTLTHYTVSAWANITADRNNAIFWRLNGSSLYPRGDVLANGSYRMQLRIDGVVDLIFAPPVQPGIHHFVFVYSLSPGTESELWLDGELVAIKSLAGSSISQGDFDLAFGVDTDLNGQLAGLLDEVRLSSEVRSHAWIRATHRIQAEPGEYVTLGPIEASPAGC